MKDMKTYAALVEGRLKMLTQPEADRDFRVGGIPRLLAESMGYSLNAGGKRLRPCMFLACVDMLGGDAESLVEFACAVEMIHTYSLIHDDLPGMDNDTMRRGRPTNHVVYGEGQAILAGDGLLNYAFETMLACAMRFPGKADVFLRAIREIATGSGVTGMIAGQVMDLQCENHPTADIKDLEFIQRNKTACMFLYPLRAAGQLCGASESQLDALTAYGEAFGLLFQATDDLLDVCGSAEEVGKTLGKDADSGKLTCISAYGIDGTRALVDQMHQRAIQALEVFGSGAELFRVLVDAMVDRVT